MNEAKLRKLIIGKDKEYSIFNIKITSNQTSDIKRALKNINQNTSYIDIEHLGTKSRILQQILGPYNVSNQGTFTKGFDDDLQTYTLEAELINMPPFELNTNEISVHIHINGQKYIPHSDITEIYLSSSVKKISPDIRMPVYNSNNLPVLKLGSLYKILGTDDEDIKIQAIAFMLGSFNIATPGENTIEQTSRIIKDITAGNTALQIMENYYRKHISDQ